MQISDTDRALMSEYDALLDRCFDVKWDGNPEYVSRLAALNAFKAQHPHVQALVWASEEAS